jgi:hypothetical protein
MKKVALSLAGVLAAAAFAPEASAIPAFARQTGMACSSCHAQHFPVLNGFGRAFKAAGFTMMGSQEKVEGEHLSIPATMNLGQLLKWRYQKTDAKGGVPKGEHQAMDEFALFMAGRVADNGSLKIGVMVETAWGGWPTGATPAGLRVPVVYEMDAAKISAVPFSTDSLGAFYGYTEGSNGTNRAIRWAEHRKEISAAQYTMVGEGAATGLAFVAHADMGYINVSKYAAGQANVSALPSTAVEIAFTPTIADFATIISANVLTGGDVAIDVGGTTTLMAPTKGNAISAQAHGELAGMETGLYLQTSTADQGSFGNAKTSATSVGAEFSVIPHALNLGVAYRAGKNNGQSDNALTFTALYDIAQNVALVANYSTYSGNAGDAGGVGYKSHCGNGNAGKSCVTTMLEAAW